MCVCVCVWRNFIKLKKKYSDHLTTFCDDQYFSQWSHICEGKKSGCKLIDISVMSFECVKTFCTKIIMETGAFQFFTQMFIFYIIVCINVFTTIYHIIIILYTNFYSVQCTCMWIYSLKWKCNNCQTTAISRRTNEWPNDRTAIIFNDFYRARTTKMSNGWLEILWGHNRNYHFVCSIFFTFFFSLFGGCVLPSTAIQQTHYYD